MSDITKLSLGIFDTDKEYPLFKKETFLKLQSHLENGANAIQQVDVSGPFSVRKSPGANRDVRVGGGDQGRSTTTPGIIWVDSKKATLTTYHDVTLWTPTDTASATKLLALWVNSSVEASDDRGSFYDYDFLTILQVQSYPDWKDGDKLYFPLAWIIQENTKNEDGDDEWNVSNIKWIERGWLLQGGGGGSPAPPEPGTTGVIPAKITSKQTGYYTADLYSNGIFRPATSSANLFMLQLNYADTIPNGTWVFAHQSALTATGGPLVP